MNLVDQVLFGYDDGHRLIAGSRSLSPRQQRDVLPHLDASFEAGEAQQLVGTAIPSLDGYLLARIWPAPERPRHGAVWAHALILTAEQLARMRLAGLLGLLNRPQDGQLEPYASALAWPPSSDDAPRPPLLRILAWGMQAPQDGPLIVLWDAPDEAEFALMTLLDATRSAHRGALSFRARQRARPASPYRIQVAASIAGPLGDARELVIDPRQDLPAHGRRD
jgi:hypothetical protein